MEAKPDDLIMSYERGAQWFWQSNSNPFQEKDPNKWNWEPYPDESCAIIEEAFFLKKLTADLGNYEINFEKMMQVNKKDAYKMRRVKREVSNKIENRMSAELPKPSFIGKEQKTFSEAFGNVHHFLDYLMKRTAEAYRIFKKLKELTLDSKLDEFNDIIQEVITSIQQAAEMRASMVNARVLSISNPLAEAKMVIKRIKDKSQDLRSFLQVVLRVYTMETFVCYFLNELLRNEDWRGLNILIPYLTCLTYTFQLQDYIIKQEPNKGVKESLLSFFKMKTLTVYRGAALTEEHLACYDPQKNKYFSWNSVTSTSRDKSIALDFLMRSIQEEKRGVLFIIETDFSLLEHCEGMIDISMISSCPTEKEVILVPGTVFKIKSRKLNNENIYEIRLEVKKKFKNNEKGPSLLGSLQQKVISKDGAILDGLTEDEIIRSVQLLAGNKLINKLEVKNCVIGGHLTELIGTMIMSTNLKPEDVKIFNNKILVDGLSLFYFFSDNLDSILCLNEIVYVENIRKSTNWRVKKLSLEDKTLRKLLANKHIKELLDRIKTEKGLIEMNLAISNIFSEDDLSEIAKIIKHQDSLNELSLDFKNTKDENRFQLERTLRFTRDMQSLSLNFSHSDLSEQELNELRDIIMDLTLIQRLSLNFESCKKVTQGGWNYLVEGLERFKKLANLCLDFKNCGNIPDKGLIKMSATLAKITTLTSLSLGFGWSDGIADNGLMVLSDSLTKLIELTELSFNFRECTKITDNGLTRLSDSLAKLNTLTSLSLSFGGGRGITDNGLTRLGDSLRKLTTLTDLTLNFVECIEIRDNGFTRIIDSLVQLNTLRNLSLNVRGCSGITDNGLMKLIDSLTKLTTLINLSLYIERDQGVNGITSLNDSLAKLTNLTNLSLEYQVWEDIADKGLTKLSDSLAKLITLTNLSLNFNKRKNITDNGLTRLRDNLKKLTKLTNLSLNFETCTDITDNGLSMLSGSLIKLTTLTNLCREITDNGLNRLSDGLATLTTLTNLSLHFRWCKNITDNGLTRLSDSLTKPTTLTNLSLNFDCCYKITDNGLTSLTDSLATLTALTNLSLHFHSCDGTTDNGFIKLRNGLANLTILTNFSLES